MTDEGDEQISQHRLYCGISLLQQQALMLVAVLANQKAPQLHAEVDQFSVNPTLSARAHAAALAIIQQLCRLALHPSSVLQSYKQWECTFRGLTDLHTCVLTAAISDDLNVVMPVAISLVYICVILQVPLQRSS